MTRYLISFDDGAMDHIPNEDWPAVGKASLAVVQEAVDAGVWVFGAGLDRQQASIVGTDGIVFARQVGMMPRDGSLPDRVLKRAFKTKVTVTRGLTH